jgi:hypothetical protein
MDSRDETLDRFFHILHQKRIMEVTQRRGEVPARIIGINDISTDEYPGYNLAEPQFSDQ